MVFFLFIGKLGWVEVFFYGIMCVGIVYIFVKGMCNYWSDVVFFVV